MLDNINKALEVFQLTSCLKNTWQVPLNLKYCLLSEYKCNIMMYRRPLTFMFLMVISNFDNTLWLLGSVQPEKDTCAF